MKKLNKFKNIRDYVLLFVGIVFLGIGGFMLGLDIDTDANAAPANSAFNDEEFYKCVIDAYNDRGFSYSYDYNLSDEQLSYITSLNCSYNISDTTGLSKLINLESISYDGRSNLNNVVLNLSAAGLTKIKSITIINAMATIDISKNNQNNVSVLVYDSLIDLNDNYSKIGTLYLSNTNLTTEILDLSTATNLTEFNLSGTLGTKIQKIIVNSNLLTDVTIMDNDSLTNVDLSMAPNLENLAIYRTGISGIELSNNLNLTNVTLDGNEELISLDISENTKLQTLKIIDNGLTSIDISNNPNLTTLSIISGENNINDDEVAGVQIIRSSSIGNTGGTTEDNGNTGGTTEDNGNTGGTTEDNGNTGGTTEDNGNTGGTTEDNGNTGGTTEDNGNTGGTTDNNQKDIEIKGKDNFNKNETLEKNPNTGIVFSSLGTLIIIGSSANMLRKKNLFKKV